MFFENIKLSFNVATVVFSLLAAGFWFYSAKARAPYKDKSDDDGWTSFSIASNGSDIIETLKKQSYWNAWVAGAAAIAAFCQAIALACD
jgi:hypothetical protein